MSFLRLFPTSFAFVVEVCPVTVGVDNASWEKLSATQSLSLFKTATSLKSVTFTINQPDFHLFSKHEGFQGVTLHHTSTHFNFSRRKTIAYPKKKRSLLVPWKGILGALPHYFIHLHCFIFVKHSVCYCNEVITLKFIALIEAWLLESMPESSKINNKKYSTTYATKIVLPLVLLFEFWLSYKLISTVLEASCKLNKRTCF